MDHGDALHALAERYICPKLGAVQCLMGTVFYSFLNWWDFLFICSDFGVISFTAALKAVGPFASFSSSPVCRCWLPPVSYNADDVQKCISTYIYQPVEMKLPNNAASIRLIAYPVAEGGGVTLGDRPVHHRDRQPFMITFTLVDNLYLCVCVWEEPRVP